MNPSEFKLVVLFRLKEGCASRFLELVDGTIEHIQGESSFIDIQVVQDLDDPDTIMLYETWSDRHDFERNQMKRDYRKAYWEGLQDIMRHPQQVMYMNLVRQA
jgi:quinol monooxygenase YgiN